MKRKTAKLSVTRETIRTLADVTVVRAGAGTNAMPAPTGAPATDGQGGCKSEMTGCHTFAVGWSCVNASCC